MRWADQYDFDKSDGPTRLFIAASNWMDRARAAEDVALELLLVVEDFLPNIGRCALQNYERLNTASIAANEIRRKREKEKNLG